MSCCELKDYFNSRCLSFAMAVAVSFIAIGIGIAGLSGALPELGMCNSYNLITSVAMLWFKVPTPKSNQQIESKRKSQNHSHSHSQSSEE